MSRSDHLLNRTKSDKTITKPHIHFLTMPCNFMISNKYQKIFSHTPGYWPARPFILLETHWKRALLAR
jgi:hypothetical protein